MRHLVCLFGVAFLCVSIFAGDEQDHAEEQAITRCAHQKAERSLRGERGERANTVRDLEGAFPGKLPKTEPGKKEDEAAAWFALVAGTGDEWRKTDAVAAGLGPMFERWKQRLELGPVPSIKREEFMRFSKQIIHNVAPAAGEGAIDTNGDADKVFRILDLNSDGELTGDELSTGLRAAKKQADANADGRISKDEYREYFRGRAEEKAEKLTTAIKANQAIMRDLEGTGKAGTGLPDWFTTLDIDKDGQISLFEWRKGGKLTTLFQEMDLNGDGLLTKDEYHRYVRMKEETLKQKKREETPP
jgi:Ca2+-binding EF-hand superfamily protein